MTFGPVYGNCPCCRFGQLRARTEHELKCDSCSYSTTTRNDKDRGR